MAQYTIKVVYILEEKDEVLDLPGVTFERL